MTTLADDKRLELPCMLINYWVKQEKKKFNGLLKNASIDTIYYFCWIIRIKNKIKSLSKYYDSIKYVHTHSKLPRSIKVILYQYFYFNRFSLDEYFNKKKKEHYKNIIYNFLSQLNTIHNDIRKILKNKYKVNPITLTSSIQLAIINTFKKMEKSYLIISSRPKRKQLRFIFDECHIPMDTLDIKGFDMIMNGHYKSFLYLIKPFEMDFDTVLGLIIISQIKRKDLEKWDNIMMKWANTITINKKCKAMSTVLDNMGFKLLAKKLKVNEFTFLI